MDLETVAHELYGLPPDQFIDARNARAAEIQKSGDHGLAVAVKRLRRPTSSAWLVNTLVRDHPGDVQRLLDLGPAMRNAQDTFDAKELRRLSGDRRTLIAALVGDARRSSGQRGQTIGAGAWRDLEATLEAAIVDSEAGAAVRKGCLTTPLHYAGLGSALPAHDGRTPPPRSPATATRSRSKERRSLEGPPGTGKAPARQRIRDAQAAVDATERTSRQHEVRLRDLRTERDHLREQASRLEDQLQDLRATEKRLVDELSSAQADQAATRRKLRADRDRLARAQKALE
ncbi:MAG TPA: hypothetical protein VHZ02_03385 [Acidimicrobiales bacterium]|nr:hypothetical protein [Acidimicrobiales bacterium]